MTTFRKIGTVCDHVSEHIIRKRKSAKCFHLGKIYEASITGMDNKKVRLFVWSLDLYIEIPTTKYFQSNLIIF